MNVNLFIFAILEFELRALHLLVATLPLEPYPSSFCFSYFLNRVLWFSLDWPGPRSSYLCLPHGWDVRYPLCSTIDRDGVLLIFYSDCP
jgi:hypothetical protein